MSATPSPATATATAATPANGSESKLSMDATSFAGRHVLVTGGSGYIGSHTVIELLQHGAICTIADNLINSRISVLERIQTVAGSRPAFELVDLCDAAACDALFAKQTKPFDAVIHFAGLKAVGESGRKPLLYYANNIVSTTNLLTCMAKYNCRNLVFSSSATVYGLSQRVPIVETEPMSTTNPYGRTKAMIEDILRDVAAGEDGAKWRIAILRYFNPIGAHPSGLLGEDPAGIPNNLLPYITQVAVGKLPFLTIFGNDYDGTGRGSDDRTGVRDYIHVVDLARGHLAALKNGVWAATRSCDEYNLGTGRGTSVLELLKCVERAAGKKIEYKVGPRRAGDVAVSYADGSKAERLLGWRATLSVEQAVKDSWNWQSLNPTGFPVPTPTPADVKPAA